MELRTPFFEKQLEAGGNLLPEGTWRLALDYQGKKEEVLNTVKGVGFIDFSSMGSIYVAGKDALNILEKFMVASIGRLKTGKGVYSLMANADGSTFGDVTIFCRRKNEYLVVTSTDKCNETVQRFKDELDNEQLEASVIEINYGILALSGPRTLDTLMKMTKDVEKLKFLDSVETELKWDGVSIPCVITRAGFTGELSYEIYVCQKYGVKTWDILMEAGDEYGIKPMGIFAIDSLRLEKGYFIAGDFYPGASPIQVGVGWNVRYNKGDFLGRDVLVEQKENGHDTELVGFEVVDSNDVAVAGSSIFKGDECIGKITSGGFGYRVNKSIAMGWINIENNVLGEVYQAKDEKSGKTLKIKVIDRMFFDPENKLIKG